MFLRVNDMLDAVESAERWQIRLMPGCGAFKRFEINKRRWKWCLGGAELFLLNFNEISSASFNSFYVLIKYHFWNILFLNDFTRARSAATWETMAGRNVCKLPIHSFFCRFHPAFASFSQRTRPTGALGRIGACQAMNSDVWLRILIRPLKMHILISPVPRSDPQQLHPGHYLVLESRTEFLADSQQKRPFVDST